MKNLKWIMPIGISLMIVMLVGCNKDDNNKTTRMNIRLTDAPCDFDSVLIDIRQIEVKSAGGDKTIQVMNPGVYNLLDFNNGLDTLLMSEDLPVGRVSQIRLILGENNHVVMNGVKTKLNTPSAQQTGLKINLQADLVEDVTYNLWLDFDACKSIVQLGNGGFNLKPVIRAFSAANSGAIAGTASPANALSYAYVLQGNDTIGTMPAVNGQFVIGGVPAGSYTVYFDANTGFQNQTASNVVVMVGQITQIGTINF